MEPSRERIEANIRRYRIFAAIAFTPVFLPIIVFFWQDHGLDLFDVFVLQAVYAVAVVLLEVPTGMVADRVGKRASLVAATAIMAVSFGLYARASGFWGFLVAEVVIALGGAFLSGADTALLYDSLRALGREGEYRQIEGRARSWSLVGFAGCNLLGGLIGSWSYQAAVLATAIGPIVALGVALGFVEVAPPAAVAGPREALAAYRSLIGGAAKFVRKHRLVRWYVGFLAVLTGSGSWLLWLYQPYMEATGLPVWAIGAAFASFNLVAAAASRWAHDFAEAVGPGRALAALGVLQVLPLLLMAAARAPLSFLFIWGHQLARGLSRPIISDLVLRYTYADKRATVLSLAALIGRLFFALSAPVVGWVAGSFDLWVCLVFQAALLAVIFGWMAWRYRAIPAKYFRVKQAVEARR